MKIAAAASLSLVASASAFAPAPAASVSSFPSFVRSNDAHLPVPAKTSNTEISGSEVDVSHTYLFHISRF